MKMKQKWIRLLCLLVALSLAALLTGCSVSDDASDELLYSTGMNAMDSLNSTIDESRKLKFYYFGMALSAFANLHARGVDGYDLTQNGQELQISGQEKLILVEASNTQVSLVGADIGRYSTLRYIEGTQLTLDDASKIGLLQTYSPLEVDNPPGTLLNAELWAGAGGTSFTNMPDSLTLKPGTWAYVDGVIYDNTQGKIDMVLPQDDIVGTPATVPAIAGADTIRLKVGYSAHKQTYTITGYPKPIVSMAPNSIGATITQDGLLTIPAGANPGTHTTLQFSAKNVQGTAEKTVNVTEQSLPLISGAQKGTDSIALYDNYGGYARHYEITGYPAPTLAMDASNNTAKATIGADGKLTLPGDLGVGTYTAHFTAKNDAGTASMAVTVDITAKEARIDGQANGEATIKLMVGYPAHTKGYAITGAPTLALAMDQNNNTAGAAIDTAGNLSIPVGLAAGTYTAHFTAANDSNTATMAVTVVVQASPTIDGVASDTDSIALYDNYGAYARHYEIAGYPAPTLAMDADNNTAKATIGADGKLTLPGDLGVGTYTAHFTAKNDVGTASMAVTVDIITKEARIDGQASGEATIKLMVGYPAHTKGYAITGSPTPELTMDAGNNTAGAAIDTAGNLSIPVGLATGTYTAHFTAANDSNTATMAVTVVVQASPTINGVESGIDTITRHEGDVERSKAYTIAGYPTPTLAMDADNNTAKATIGADGKLTLPAGMAAGLYTAHFTATNDAGTASMAVAMAVEGDVLIDGFNQDGTDAIVLKPGYAAYTKGYAITGYPTPELTMDAGNNTAGAAIDAAGNLTIPAGLAAGTYTARFTAKNRFSKADMTVSVWVTPITLGPATLPNPVKAMEYAAQLSASGGTEPYTYSVADGSALPYGLSLDADSGKISGTTDGSGMLGFPYSFTICVKDKNGSVSQRQYTFTVTDSVQIISSFLGDGEVGGVYEGGLYAADSNTNPATGYEIVSGSLPPGLVLHALTGEIKGTPTAAGSYTFTVKPLLGSLPGVPCEITILIALASPDATLSALAVDQGTLTPAFAPGTASYTVSVANDVTDINIAATATHPNASVSGGGVVSLDVGANTATITVTAANGTATQAYTLTVTRAASPDATLSALAVDQGTLTPAFAPGTASYTVSVANDVTDINIAATATHPNASVSGGGVVSLDVGANTATITVTAANGTATQAYTLTVTRAASPDATLSALAVDQGTLTPAFAPGTASYTVSVANDVTDINIAATATHPNASVSGGGVVSLDVGANTATITVTAANGTATQAYTLTVTRAAAPAQANATLPNLAVNPKMLTPAFDPGSDTQAAAPAPGTAPPAAIMSDEGAAGTPDEAAP